MSFVILNGSVYITFHSFSSILYFLFHAILPVGGSLSLFNSLYMFGAPFVLFKYI